ncbi:GC-type dockerin domain-anchored protein [Corallococcus sp. Z5C101001]|uniref:GC-type dockerin domain-anchored protein n=1 Tax=Corallococcus sp. Z5C101001 TaxID=2596829 RepID=UPI00117F866E|nr:GC-type dockerin domain-anchored protein [Corallococcus sp. Z5C101001]TSC22688.1 hypothetical protein FOF48_32780 [Corallococcus sp. Z5C101001]
MRFMSLCLGAVPLFVATAANAQTITPIEGSRSVSASISAVDAVTNVVQSDSRGTNGFAAFNESLSFHANTQYEGSRSRVDANASGTQQSTITASRITASVSTSAEGVALDRSARGQGVGNADFYLTFEVNRRARYVVTGNAQATSNASNGGTRFGGSTALLYIANLESGIPVLSIDIGDSDSDSVSRTGWMPAGPYTLQGDVSALVDANGRFSGTASASWALDLKLFCASDFDANGVVNAADSTAFLSAWSAGLLTADIDGNGVINTADRDVFQLAYGRGC